MEYKLRRGTWDFRWGVSNLVIGPDRISRSCKCDLSFGRGSGKTPRGRNFLSPVIFALDYERFLGSL